MKSDRQPDRHSVPYIDNLGMVLLVVAINLATTLAFVYGRPIVRETVLIEAAICGVTTAFIDVFYCYYTMGRKRRQGLLPAGEAPSAFMRKLPVKPLPLSLLLGAFVALLMPLIAQLVLSFYGIAEHTFHRFLAWKIVYSCVLSAKLMELCVLRYMQPDCQSPDDPPQTGAQALKNPLPKAGMFGRLFNTVTTDFGFNLLLGVMLGSVKIAEQSVIIPPTQRSSLVVSAAILGLIVTFRMMVPMVKSISALRDSGQLPMAEKPNPFLSRLPRRPFRFALLYAPVLMALTPAVFYAIFAFFGFETLNFFQYFVLRTLYTSLLSKPAALLAVARYRQPFKAPRSAKKTPVSP